MLSLVAFLDFLADFVVDGKVPQTLGGFLNCLTNVIGSLVINIVVTPLVIIPLIPMGYMYEYFRARSDYFLMHNLSCYMIFSKWEALSFAPGFWHQRVARINSAKIADFEGDSQSFNFVDKHSFLTWFQVQISFNGYWYAQSWTTYDIFYFGPCKFDSPVSDDQL